MKPKVPEIEELRKDVQARYGPLAFELSEYRGTYHLNVHCNKHRTGEEIVRWLVRTFGGIQYAGFTVQQTLGLNYYSISFKLGAEHVEEKFSV